MITYSWKQRQQQPDIFLPVKCIRCCNDGDTLSGYRSDFWGSLLNICKWPMVHVCPCSFTWGFQLTGTLHKAATAGNWSYAYCMGPMGKQQKLLYLSLWLNKQQHLGCIFWCNSSAKFSSPEASSTCSFSSTRNTENKTFILFQDFCFHLLQTHWRQSSVFEMQTFIKTISRQAHSFHLWPKAALNPQTQSY